MSENIFIIRNLREFLIYEIWDLLTYFAWLRFSRKERSFSLWKDAAVTWRGPRSWRQSTVWRDGLIFCEEHPTQLFSQDPDEVGDTLVSGHEGERQDTREEVREDIIRGESETTEYDFSTDDESLRWGENSEEPASQPVLLPQIIFLRDRPVSLLLWDLLQKVECRISAQPSGGGTWGEVQVYWGSHWSQGEDQTGGEEEENVPAEAERLSGLWRNLTRMSVVVLVHNIAFLYKYQLSCLFPILYHLLLMSSRHPPTVDIPPNTHSCNVKILPKTQNCNE